MCGTRGSRSGGWAKETELLERISNKPSEQWLGAERKKTKVRSRSAPACDRRSQDEFARMPLAQRQLRFVSPRAKMLAT